MVKWGGNWTISAVNYLNAGAGRDMQNLCSASLKWLNGEETGKSVQCIILMLEWGGTWTISAMQHVNGGVGSDMDHQYIASF